MLAKLNAAFGAPKKRQATDDIDDFQLSMRTTANCRHNASVRLLWRSTVTFNATVVLSLSLVFIPLMQNSGVSLELKDGVLNMLQVFLGVAVLVYSTIIGTAHYEVRALQLAQCADSIKELIRDLKLEKLASGNIPVPSFALAQKRYAELLTSSENHIEADYRLAMLSMYKDYTVPFATRALLRLKTVLSTLAPLLTPALLVAIIAVFLGEMFGLSGTTKVYLPSWRR
jgi:hypothetical protein